MGVEEPPAELSTTPWLHSTPSLGLGFLLHKRGQMILPGSTCLAQLALGELGRN